MPSNLDQLQSRIGYKPSLHCEEIGAIYVDGNQIVSRFAIDGEIK
jgi:hypothetical protein